MYIESILKNDLITDVQVPLGTAELTSASIYRRLNSSGKRVSVRAVFDHGLICTNGKRLSKDDPRTWNYKAELADPVRKKRLSLICEALEEHNRKFNAALSIYDFRLLIVKFLNCYRALIIGASKQEQLVQNVDFLNRHETNTEIVSQLLSELL